MARRIMFRAVAALAVTAALFLVLALWRPSGLYLWLKAAHVVAVTAWMAGMLYLPVLFAYHCDVKPGASDSETFKVMERRLLTVIINPAMVATWALGLWLAWDGGFLGSGWLRAKLALVLAMSALHGMLSRWTRDFSADRNRHVRNFYRTVSVALVALMAAIVIVVVVKPL